MGLTLHRLENSGKDIPIALLYSVADTQETSRSNPTLNHEEVSNSIICVLEGCTGLPSDHILIPERVKIAGHDEDDTVLSGCLRTALKELIPVEVPIESSSRDILNTLGERSQLSAKYIYTQSTH
jgi:hypothetical protein